MVDDMLGIHVEQARLPCADQLDESTDGDKGVHAKTGFIGPRSQMWLRGEKYKFSRLLERGRPVILKCATDMMHQEDLSTAGVTRRAFYDGRNRSAKGNQHRLMQIANEYARNFAEHFITSVLPRRDEQSVAVFEVLVKIPIVQRGPGTDTAHRDCGPAAFTPNLGRCVD